MSRARNIKPGFFRNEHLAECDPLARILFAGLWTEADREGRLEDRPKRLKAELLPYDNCDVSTLLDQLVQWGFIRRYAANGHRYIQVLEFKKHQNPHVKEAESTIPAPDSPEVSKTHNGNGTPGKNGASTGQEQDKPSPQPERAGLIPDSLLLIPDSPNPHPARVLRAAVLARFPEFWREYPKREAKPKAETAWEKHVKSLETVEAILANVRLRKTSEAWTKEGGQFVPLPATYLNQHRWEDEANCSPEDEPDEVVAARVMAKIQAEDRERAGMTQ